MFNFLISNFFENAFHSLSIKQTNVDNYGFIAIAIKKYEQHPSINLIKENITNHESFHFLSTEPESILKEIINLDNKKMELLKAFLLVVSRMYQIYVALF